MNFFFDCSSPQHLSCSFKKNFKDLSSQVLIRTKTNKTTEAVKTENLEDPQTNTKL